jgi:hypothetical protein
MDPAPWERVVPISCVHGEHHWKQLSDYWERTRCQHCDAVKPTEEP